MDPVTHAASGAVAMLALSRRPATLWSLPLAAAACAAPDIDLAFIHTPLEFLLLHRGITHSFAAMPFLALVLALLCWPLWRQSTPGRWRFSTVWLFCCAMILLHIWLDVVTTYGTMVFLPFSHYRVRLNSIYIIDPLVTLPLLWAVWRWRFKRNLLIFTLIWTFLYPASGIALNAWHTAQCRARFAESGRQVERLHVLPDAFAPFFWRAIFEEEAPGGLSVREQSLNGLGQPRAPENVYPAADAALARRLEAVSTDCHYYFQFAMLPVMENLRQRDFPADLPDRQNAVLLMFYDLRFGSGLAIVRKLLAMRPNADIPFQLMSELLPVPPSGTQPLADMDINRIRLRFSDSGRDSSWHKPVSPQKPDFWHWLVGLQ